MIFLKNTVILIINQLKRNLLMLKIIHIFVLKNDKNPKFKVGDRVRISKYKNIFAKDAKLVRRNTHYQKKLRILYHGHMLLMTLMVKKLLIHFMKINCKRLIKKNSE